MPVTLGKLFDKEVSVLRDTGCSIVVVKKDLVPDEALTGKVIACVLIDGTVRRMPTAMIEMDTRFYEGKIEAVCMRRAIYDLIVGNVAGVVDVDQTELTEDESSEDMTVKDQVEMETEVVQAVMTRQQTQHAGKREKPLNVMKGVSYDISVDEVKQLQKNDETLAGCWQKAEEVMGENNQGNGTSFVVKNGLLYRKRQDEGRLVTQLAVPQQLRDKCCI